MSSLGKIQKNADKYRLEELYKNMTPELYQEGIRKAVNSATSELANQYDIALEKTTNEYNEKLKKVQEQANLRIDETRRLVTNIISVELLYELGNQLECFKEDAEYLEQKIEVVQNIYQNTMDSIYKYVDGKDSKQSYKEFQKKKKKVAEIFGIKE